MALIKCNECGKEISDKATTCIHCGYPVKQKIKCAECGKDINTNDKICNGCGCPIENQNNDKKERQQKVKNKKTILIVGSIIFTLTIFITIFSFFVNNKIDIKGSYYYNNNYIELNSNGNCFYEDNEFGFTNIDCNYSITNNNSIIVQYTSQSVMYSDNKYTHKITFTITDDKNLKDENNNIYKKQ